MNKDIKIVYGDVTPEAKENFTYTASETELGNNYQKQLQTYNFKAENYASPCERYFTLLDGSQICPERGTIVAKSAFVSKSLSGDDGSFAEPITLVCVSTLYFKTSGLTFIFDEYNDIYATKVTIDYIQSTDGVDTVLQSVVCYPDSYMYFCRSEVTHFNKIIIKFYSLNMPANRLRLTSVDFGFGTIFKNNNITNIAIDTAVSPVSADIQINTAVIDLCLDRGTENLYSFSKKQNMSIMENENVLFNGFIENSERTSQYNYTITTEDYLGIMEDKTFFGDIYIKKSAKSLIEKIFSTCCVPYVLDEDFEDMSLTGTIELCTCREALRQVAFACGLTVISKGDGITLSQINFDSVDVSQYITKDRVMGGMTITEDKIVTEVFLYSNNYTKAQQVNLSSYVYKTDNMVVIAENVQPGTYTFVSDVPIHTPMCGRLGTFYGSNSETTEGFNTKESYGEVLSSTAYTVTVNITLADADVVGWKYNNQQTSHSKKNNVLLANTIDNVITVKDATLISEDNVEKILDKYYNYLMKNETVDARIIEGKHEQINGRAKWGEFKWGAFKWGAFKPRTVTKDKPISLGEKIEFETEYQGNRVGTVIAQNYNINGNIVVKEVTLV